MKAAERRHRIFLRALVNRCEPCSTQNAVCGLNDRNAGREYLVVDEGLGQELAGYVGDEVEVRGTIREQDGSSWISVFSFRPSSSQEADIESDSRSWDRNSYRRDGFRSNDPERSRMRSHTKARQAARRLKNDQKFGDA